MTSRPSTRRVARSPSIAARPNVVPRTCAREPLPPSVTEQESPEQDTRLTDPDPPPADALTAPDETPAPPAAVAPLPEDDRAHAASSVSRSVGTRAPTCAGTVRVLGTEDGTWNGLLTGHLRTDE